MNSNKLSIPIPLVLMGSLVIMLAATPAVNIFPNAIAQGYDDRSSYRTYPTEEKKYECRTGPFEGFFVGSVEFCKHVKFDDNKSDHSDNNQTGTQGPPGANGTQGGQGPPGITQLINGTKIYLVTNSSTVSANDLGQTVTIALCQSGDFILNGGYILNNLNPSNNILVPSNVPLTGGATTGQGWLATVIGANDGLILTVQAYCFDNSP